MSVDTAIRDAMLSTVPSLRAFAISLCKDTDRADDLVQETLLRAWAHIESFVPGTNMAAWLFTILRNAFHSEMRKRRREVADTDGVYAGTLKSEPQQPVQRQFEELRAALVQLPVEQSEALLLIAASGFSYEEAARICGCAVGTIKSRVNRARERLADLLQIDNLDDFGPEAQQRAVFAHPTPSIHAGVSAPEHSAF
jgi:RNA polymerase sigma-70 factor, ECF subfamily